MVLGNNGEVLTYALTAALAISAGLTLGSARSSRHKAASLIAGLLIVASVVVASVALGAQAPWMGPIFAIVAVLTTTLAAAEASADNPALKDESFGRRLALVLSRRDQRLVVDEEN
ncbi:hypothetical protein [Microbacterium sp. NPDC055665]